MWGDGLWSSSSRARGASRAVLQHLVAGRATVVERFQPRQGPVVVRTGTCDGRRPSDIGRQRRDPCGGKTRSHRLLGGGCTAHRIRHLCVARRANCPPHEKSASLPRGISLRAWRGIRGSQQLLPPAGRQCHERRPVAYGWAGRCSGICSRVVYALLAGECDRRPCVDIPVRLDGKTLSKQVPVDGGSLHPVGRRIAMVWMARRTVGSLAVAQVQRPPERKEARGVRRVPLLTLGPVSRGGVSCNHRSRRYNLPRRNNPAGSAPNRNWSSSNACGVTSQRVVCSRSKATHAHEMAA